MARIRSIHPGLTSDESFMSMSMTAKAAWTPLWMQCDDHGIFEWKPIVLKALIFPADNVDFADVLAELERLECIRRIDIEGKPYGIVRNFARYQRPKNPSYRHFKAEDLPADIGKYIGVKGVATPALPQPTPSTGENAAQRKEEGGRRRGKEDLPNNIDKSVVVVLPGRSTTTTTEGSENRIEGRPATLLPPDWQPDEAGIEFAHSKGMTDATVDDEIVGFKSYNHGRSSMSSDWPAYWRRWCIEWKERQTKPAKAPPRIELNSAPDWDSYASRFARGLGWPKGVGPDPDSAACRCPPDILAKHNIGPKAKVQA